jgi:hypothetical protein
MSDDETHQDYRFCNIQISKQSFSITEISVWIALVWVGDICMDCIGLGRVFRLVRMKFCSNHKSSLCHVKDGTKNRFCLFV